MREIKVHSHLNHPNIIDLYGVFEDRDSIYLVQEFCTNGDLHKMLRHRRKCSQDLELQEVATIIREACSAV